MAGRGAGRVLGGHLAPSTTTLHTLTVVGVPRGYRLTRVVVHGMDGRERRAQVDCKFRVDGTGTAARHGTCSGGARAIGSVYNRSRSARTRTEADNLTVRVASDLLVDHGIRS